MQRSILLLTLPVLLRSVLTEAKIECFSNVFPDDTGIASNAACQISYSLTKVNGCDVITGALRLSATGRHHQKVLRDPSFLNLYVNSYGDCRQAGITEAYTKLQSFVNTTNPHTGELLPGPVKTAPAIDCAISGSETMERGNYCVFEISLIEGTCYKRNEAPILSAGLGSEEEVCTSTKKVRVTCNINNCNADKEIIRRQISDGFAFTGGSPTPECRNELLQSIDTHEIFEAPNSCGPGGTAGSNGTCECKAGWVDIITMEDMPVGHNHTEGELCVPQNSCVNKNEEYIITFLVDASIATYRKRNGSFEGVKHFVLNAEKLIDSSSNRIIFVAYGGSVTKVSKLNYIGWSRSEFEETVDAHLADYVGESTNIADGFDKTRELLEEMDSHFKRIVIHIGDGIPSGIRKDKAQSAYEQLADRVERVLSVGVAGDGGNMKHRWHTPGDYVDFSTVRYENLNLDNMKFLMQRVCPQQSYEELINNSSRLNKH